MKKGIVNKTNDSVHDGEKGQKVTILKEYFYNGEDWYSTKEIGEIPAIFVDEPKLTLDEFKKSRKKVNLAFMQEHYSFGDYGGQSVDDSDHLDPEFYVYGVDGEFGWIEIRDTENSNNSMKYFLQISNWDDCSDDLDYFEKKLYEDHYLHNI